ncbi:DUF2852 domain-containing protein [Loktanella sp. SALINAS62]|uniref:DUF2852 domain-containing protein n=1 Tax=Loktanella sp. SALINAS62 TaxID=2706124 RepID=UPI001B8C4A3A|nr:DUF2852 domain-containing protein [Loktanella sp. SALINAS62]MBS1303563.1 DUF2852 domain-containing protein [Loktanella sp. SALINAS62]
MTATHTYPAVVTGPVAWAQRVEAWLDARGRGAWIATMVIAMIVAWPVGLAVLAYMIFGNKFSKGAASSKVRPSRMMATSGNTAFDAYKQDTLHRLQEEQDEFTAFLGRLREAKDKAEFDQFMADRTPKDRDVDASDKDA